MSKPESEFARTGKREYTGSTERKMKAQRIGDWFQNWQQPIRRFLKTRGGRVPDADLDDIAQEVFLRLLRYDSAELVTNPQGYLFTVAANVATEWSVRAHRRLPHSADWLEEVVFEDPAEVEAANKWTERQLLVVLGGMPTRAREILRLYFYEELTHEQIATRLGVSRRMVKRDLISSYERLRTELDCDVASDFGAGSSRINSRKAPP